MKFKTLTSIVATAALVVLPLQFSITSASAANAPCATGWTSVDAGATCQKTVTSTGTVTTPLGVTSVDVVAVGGGGGAHSTSAADWAGTYDTPGGGGGGGEVKICTNVAVTYGSSVSVTIGAGGGEGSNNTATDGAATTFGSACLAAGGKGSSFGTGGDSGNGKSGGSPVHSGRYWQAGYTMWQWLFSGGGGAGAGQNGIDGVGVWDGTNITTPFMSGAGGAGLQLSAAASPGLFSTDTSTYGGGGGGGGMQSGYRIGGVGGVGGGGSSCPLNTGMYFGFGGAANTGGGAGATCQANTIGASGGSGIVKLRYSAAQPFSVAPGKPGTPSASGLDGAVRIAPVAPATGGQPASYLVTADPGGAQCTVTLPATYCDITGLTNGTSYSFTVTATNESGTSISSDPVTMTPYPLPTVTAISPNVGYIDGGETVVISGTNFITGSTVKIGGADCTSVVVMTTTTISCVTPARPAGLKHVFVYLPNGAVGYKTNAYTYSALPGTTSAVSFLSNVITQGTLPSATTAITVNMGTTDPTGTVAWSYCYNANDYPTACDLTVDTDLTGHTADPVVTGLAGDGISGVNLNNFTLPYATGYYIFIANYSGDSVMRGSWQSASLYVSPIVAPSAPGTPTGTAGNGSVNLSWTAPSTGDAPITYTVTSTPAGASCTVTGTTASCTGLTNGTAYTFVVTASNGGGSADSASSAALTPKLPVVAPAESIFKPQRPKDSEVTLSREFGALKISMNYSGTLPYKPTSYIVTVSPGGNSCTIAIGQTSCVIVGLVYDVEYSLSIVAANSNGKSDALQVAEKAVLSGSAGLLKFSFKLQLTGFAGNSAKLTAVFKSKIKAFLSAHLNIKAVTCTGYTAGTPVTKADKVLAKARATSVCNYIQSLKPSIITTTIGKTPGLSWGAINRKVLLQAYKSTN